MPYFRCDLAQTPSPLLHYWEHTVGSGHALLGLRADWQTQLQKCHDELGFEHVRFHGLLSDDMGTLIRQQGELLYSFFNIDRIYDFLHAIGMRPFVELSFMPLALSSGNQTVFKYAANVTPPQDYEQWGTLIRRLVTHWVQRYGLSDVRRWYFEVWNEPNMDSFWTGNQADYFELYRHTVRAIKAVDDSLQVGGPVTAQNAWIEAFLDFCQENNLPVDFVSTHQYPTDAFGEPDDDTETQLAKSERGVLRQRAQESHRQARGHPLYYTEWNSSSNPRDPLHDEPYSAAFATKTVLEAKGLVDGYSFWTFSDIFEENYFPSQPFHGGFGLLNLYGIPKPTYRAYQLLHQLGNEQFTVVGNHRSVDVWAVRREDRLTILLTNHALPRHPIQQEQVEIEIANASRPRQAYVARIDEDHANPRRLWEWMERPDYLDAAQVEQLQAASRLIDEPLPLTYEARHIHVDLDLPPHAVAAVTVELA